jgi:hypothetical protein
MYITQTVTCKIAEKYDNMATDAVFHVRKDKKSAFVMKL